LSGVTIPNGVASIEDFTFYQCYNLARVTVPRSVTNIGNYAFAYCMIAVYFQGNTPAVASSAFYFDAVSHPIYSFGTAVYYLPGTTGWSSFSANNAGLPVVLWNPLIQASGASFGVQNNQFGFNIIGTADIPIVVVACTNLASPFWTPLQTAILTNGLLYFSDPQWTNYPGRYYRIRSP
jgi:hypothetical protein